MSLFSPAKTAAQKWRGTVRTCSTIIRFRSLVTVRVSRSMCSWGPKTTKSVQIVSEKRLNEAGMFVCECVL
jgi:hypothetical protein